MSAPANLLPLVRDDTDGGAGERARAARAERWRHLRPHRALVYVENRCHLSCLHCYESEKTHPSRAHMTLEQYRVLFDELARLGVLYLTFSGGEIFLRRDIFELIALARARRFAVTLYTTGTHIDEQKADRLAALKPHAVEISVYSVRPEAHDAFTRVPGSHARSVNALELLAARGIKTVLKSNLMPFNVDEIDELIAFANALGADYTLDPGIRARLDGDTAPLELALSPEVLRKKVLSRPDLAAHFRERSAEQLCTGERALLEGDGAMCSAARQTIAIGADGGVYACAMFPVPGGRLGERSLEDIWLGAEQFDAVRSATMATMNECGTCDVKSTCQPCMAQSLADSSDLRGCSTTSRVLAESLGAMAAKKARANVKMAKGRALRVVDAAFTPPKAKGR